MSAGNERGFIDFLQDKEKGGLAMKCPLFTIMDKRTQLGEESDYCECLKEECAWWEKEGESCALLLLGLRLGTVCDQLTDFIDKMPHVEQFKK